ncbi:hypothetical protein [uncultured Jannaschia sp.]|uniref:hypothetical protein n=1 Tax=uncultured Jannaschia sp. TaxID=293347 RepID=UPI002613A46B|nr:hypothetical protein [uncultured Jannaschia sp.]
MARSLCDLDGNDKVACIIVAGIDRGVRLAFSGGDDAPITAPSTFLLDARDDAALPEPIRAFAEEQDEALNLFRAVDFGAGFDTRDASPSVGPQAQTPDDETFDEVYPGTADEFIF